MRILQKHAPALTIRAGHQARDLILKEGLQPEHVDIVPGAAGGPKGTISFLARSNCLFRIFC